MANNKNVSILKDAHYNKIRASILCRPKLTESLFTTEFSIFPDCFTKDQVMYHSNKSLQLQIFDSNPSAVQTIKSNCIIIDLSAVTRSQAASSNANTFDEFDNEVI